MQPLSLYDFIYIDKLFLCRGPVRPVTGFPKEFSIIAAVGKNNLSST